MDCGKKYPSAEQRKELEQGTIVCPMLENTKYHRKNLSRGCPMIIATDKRPFYEHF